MPRNEVDAAADRFLSSHKSTRPVADQVRDARRLAYQAEYADDPSAAVYHAIADRLASK